MSLAQWFGFGSNSSGAEMPLLFELSVTQRDFVEADVQAIYAKILTDVVSRLHGLSEDDEALLWDSCVASDSTDGLITLLAKAMAAKAELFVVYDKAAGVLRKANDAEAAQIRADYKAKAESKVGTFITFKEYRRTDMIKLYSTLEYCTIAALNKKMNVAKAVQIKISDLRSTVSSIDSAEIKTQAKAIADGLGEGKDVLIDAKDSVENGSPDVSSTEAAMNLINEKRAFYLELPASYITGQAPKGLGDSGEGDARAIDRGLKSYFVCVLKPVLRSLFGLDKLEFKSEDFRQLSTSLEALKTFELVSDELLSSENKRMVVNRLFGFPPDTKGGPKAPAAAPRSSYQGGFA